MVLTTWVRSRKLVVLGRTGANLNHRGHGDTQGNHRGIQQQAFLFPSTQNWPPSGGPSVCTFRASGINISRSKFFFRGHSIHDPKPKTACRHACPFRPVVCPVLCHGNFLPTKGRESQGGCRAKKRAHLLRPVSERRQRQRRKELRRSALQGNEVPFDRP